MAFGERSTRVVRNANATRATESAGAQDESSGPTE
jgi:hypothetical protein